MHFGGHVELHETPWAAVIHEVREESGYELDQLRLLQPPHALANLNDRSVSHPLPFVLATHPFGADETHFHTDITYIFITDEEPRHPIGEEESGEIRLFTRNEIDKLPPEQTPNNLRVMALYAFDKILSEWQAVDPNNYHTTSLTS